MVSQTVTQTVFGARNNIAQPMVSGYLRGAFSTSRQRANVIQRATRGAVPSGSWDELPTAKELAEHARNMKTLRLQGLERAWKGASRAARRRKAAA